MSSDPAVPVRVRFAPSPTGPIHVGTARSALFNWIFARQRNGTFILRIEDTDRERSKDEYEKQAIEGLRWIGIDWDEGPRFRQGFDRKADPGQRGEYGPYRQSERTHIYKHYLEELLNRGQAYFCYCTPDELEARREALRAEGLAPKYAGTCRALAPEERRGRTPQVIRFKTPGAKVTFTDLIRGKVTFDASLFGDFVIAKSTDAPLYNFAAVVDDHEMKITHVIRGEDHLSNTPKQILIGRALGFDAHPTYAHLPLILAPDRSKLSKRYTETSLLAYRDEGYLPQAMMNFLALLGWHPTDDEEVLSAEELLEKFDIARVQKGGAIFNVDKLQWINQQYIRRLSTDVLFEYLQPILDAYHVSASPYLTKKVIEVERDRMKKLTDFVELTTFFFTAPTDYNARELLPWKTDSVEKTKHILLEVRNALGTVKRGEITAKEVGNALASLRATYGNGPVLWPLRAALSGQRTSPDPLTLVSVLGVGESIKRLNYAIEKLGSSTLL